ncbi:MAG: cyclopropane fatty-acyl-phospholipid synthase-like methyltransferase [Algoriphagus sp.]|jgi:cyclopropane fatty-acyl-phospholipid synthase-like methyltransferase
MKKSKIQSELWRQSPKGLAEIKERLHKPYCEAMLNQTGVEKETTSLDVGCGSGGSILAKERGAEVHGIDVAEGLILLQLSEYQKNFSKLRIS